MVIFLHVKDNLLNLGFFSCCGVPSPDSVTSWDENVSYQFSGKCLWHRLRCLHVCTSQTASWGALGWVCTAWVYTLITGLEWEWLESISFVLVKSYQKHTCSTAKVSRTPLKWIFNTLEETWMSSASVSLGLSRRLLDILRAPCQFDCTTSWQESVFV